MTYELDLDGKDAADAVIDPQITLEYNAMHGGQVVIRQDQIARSDAFTEGTFSFEGAPLLQCEVQAVRTDQPEDGQATVDLLGPALRLTRSGPDTEVTYDGTTYWEAIDDYWTNQVSDVSHTVYEPSSTVAADGIALNDDHLSNLQKLHRDGGLRFVAEPDVRSPLTVESFERGEPDVVSTLDVTVKEDSRSRVVTNYANEVELVWFDSNDNRQTATAEDTDEQTRVGKTIKARAVNTSVETQAAADSAAESELSKRIANDEEAGSVQTNPQIILPGYPYTVPEWDDTTADLTRSSYSNPATGGRTTLQFQRDRDIAERVGSLQEGA